jgi:amino acid permease
MIVRVALANNVDSYDGVILRVLGRRWLRVFQAFMVLSSLGSLTAYLMLSADFVQTLAVIIGTPISNRRAVVALLSIGIMLPLALLRTMASLAFTSFLSMVFGMFLAVALVVVAAGTGVDSSVEWVPTDGAKFFQGVSIITMAMYEGGRV